MFSVKFISFPDKCNCYCKYNNNEYYDKCSCEDNYKWHNNTIYIIDNLDYCAVLTEFKCKDDNIVFDSFIKFSNEIKKNYSSRCYIKYAKFDKIIIQSVYATKIKRAFRKYLKKKIKDNTEISIKFHDNKFVKMRKDFLIKIPVFRDLFRLNDIEISEIDLSTAEFITYENLIIAEFLSSSSNFGNILSKTLDYLFLPNNFMSISDYNIINDIDIDITKLSLFHLRLYFKCIDKKIRKFYEIINDVPLSFIKEFITNKNINEVYIEDDDRSIYSTEINNRFNILDVEYYTGYHIIEVVETIPVVEYFIECGLDKYLDNPYTVGCVLAVNGNYEVVKRLIEYGLRYDITNENTTEDIITSWHKTFTKEQYNNLINILKDNPQLEISSPLLNYIEKNNYIYEDI